eukprot:TRINITY_DN4997_c0_g1_i1.p1 TRINITY_DN4997_c0_g1~~TRINITY_DN4997_c0_g1_i1.p1  ORF type:complete len:268 (+),score=108.67 TRINITY_DN4997_c0_g1_i1:61-864(+)
MAGQREQQAGDLFKEWDLDGSGCIEFPELQQVLLSSERIQKQMETKHGRKLVAKLKGQLAEHGRLRPLSKDDFVHFLLSLVDAADWADTVPFLEDAIKSARELTADDRRKRVQWSVFQLLDVNQDGVVEWSELQQLFEPSREKTGSGRRLSREQRKTSIRWQVALHDKAMSAQTAPIDGQPELRLSLEDFHRFMDDIFKDQTDEEYVEAITEIQEHLSKHNSESAHREYLRSENIPDLVNSMVSYVLEQKKEDPLDSIIEFLEKQQS